MKYKNREKRDSTALLSEVDDNDRPCLAKAVNMLVGESRRSSQSTVEENKKQDLVKDILL